MLDRARDAAEVWVIVGGQHFGPTMRAEEVQWIRCLPSRHG
jgi:hypothetical protein